jgi:hypothetical protein
MRFLSREDLLTIARFTALPATTRVRSQLDLRLVLTVPTQGLHEDTVPTERLLEAVSMFATLFVHRKPFTDFNEEITARCVDTLLVRNGLQLQAPPDDLLVQLSRLKEDLHFTELAKWFGGRVQAVDSTRLLEDAPFSTDVRKDS